MEVKNETLLTLKKMLDKTILLFFCDQRLGSLSFSLSNKDKLVIYFF